MKEKILIKSEHYNAKKALSIIMIASIAVALLGLFLWIANVDGCRFYESYFGGLRYLSLLENMLDPFSLFPGLCIDFGLIVFIISAIIAWWLSSYQLTVTDKRIYGITSFTKRVDLPVDSVSAVATTALKGIVIATSSGKIAFNLIKNRDDVHSVISNLIISRQSHTIVTESQNAYTHVDELKKYKELLDNGIITQEEFDAKKKHLLDL